MKTLSDTRILFKNVLKLKKMGFYCPTDSPLLLFWRKKRGFPCPTDSPLLLPKLSTTTIRDKRSDDDEDEDEDDEDDEDEKKCLRID